ncbi:MAG: hypothetical protein AAF713_00915 [Pseudomonadota bacterium]
MGDTCKGTHVTAAVSVREARLDRAEQDVLHSARLFFQTFAVPESHSWIAALQDAQRRFHPQHGLDVAWRILAAIQAMRTSRKSTFSFNNPCCPQCALGLSQHERQFIGVLAALRCRQRSVAETHAMLLCEGNATAPLLEAMAVLSASLGPRAAEVGQSPLIPSHE